MHHYRVVYYNNLSCLQVGDNMPCVNTTLLEAVYTQDANGLNTKGTIDFGLVSNTGEPKPKYI